MSSCLTVLITTSKFLHRKYLFQGFWAIIRQKGKKGQKMPKNDEKWPKRARGPKIGPRGAPGRPGRSKMSIRGRRGPGLRSGICPILQLISGLQGTGGFWAIFGHFWPFLGVFWGVRKRAQNRQKQGQNCDFWSESIDSIKINGANPCPLQTKRFT